VDLIIESILFLWNMIFTFYYMRVRPSAITPFLGGHERRRSFLSHVNQCERRPSSKYQCERRLSHLHSHVTRDHDAFMWVLEVYQYPPSTSTTPKHRNCEVYQYPPLIFRSLFNCSTFLTYLALRWDLGNCNILQHTATHNNPGSGNSSLARI